MAVIMLSYSRKDEDTVKALVQGFEAAKRGVWFDHNLGGGDAWWDAILENIRTAMVFLFALSDSSLHSKACRLELDYALALGRPILPVQVGPITSFRANPLAALQIITYNPQSAQSGFAILAAVDAAAQRARPLPDPLPPPPPIPFGYLLALGRQIDSIELSVGDQVAVVDQLRRALGEETDEAARLDVLAMLRNLNRKPWTTKRTEREIAALLFAHAPTAVADDRAGHATPERARPHDAEQAPSPAAGSASPGPEPDPREWFAERLERLQRQRAAQERATDPDPPPWRAPSDAAARWGRTFGREEPPGPAAGTASSRRGPGPNPAPSSYFAAPAPPQPGGGAPGASRPDGGEMAAGPGGGQPAVGEMAAGRPVTGQQLADRAEPPAGWLPQVGAPTGLVPPRYWALSIVAVPLSLGVFGGVALYFSAQVGRRHGAGNLAGARRASSNARAWGIVGIVVGGLFWLIVLNGLR